MIKHRKAQGARKAAPENGEARINHHSDSGFSSKQSKHRNDTCQPQKGKAIDSRTKVIEQAKLVTIGIPFHATPPAKLAALTKLRHAHPGCSAKAQEELLEKALRRWPLTFREMWAAGMQDGRARIYGLKQRGLDIDRTWVIVEDEYGQRHRVGLYSLRRGSSTVAPSPKQADLFGGAALAARDAVEVAK
jgi:Helix-turn-helix domain